MNVTINGQATQLPDNCTISQMLKQLGYEQGFIAVAMDQNCVPRSQYQSTPVKDGCKLEILAPMAGG